MAENVTCLVRGAASRYPRGYLALIPIWFVALALGVLLASRHLSGRLPLWLGLCEIGSLVLAAVILLGVLATVRRHAFRADHGGIWLGVLTTRRRPRRRLVRLDWADVAQIRMVPRRYGLLMEIGLAPSARRSPRLSPLAQAAVWLGALLLPFMFGRGWPALTMPAAHRHRYLVKVCATTPAQLKVSLSALAPETVAVRSLSRRTVLQFVVPPQRRLPATRPTPAIRP
ncbi:MAG TPA: hypothetical protein VGI58_03960 [Streptosporangiaceae bacterium]|jgi:hypothetical protein